jgi:hypothetical protein
MTTDRTGVGALQAGQTSDARVTLADGRTMPLRVTVAAPRPRATLLAKSVERPAPSALSLTLPGGDLIPQNARVTFSIRAEGSTRFGATDKVEIEAADTGQHATLSVNLQDSGVAIAAFTPAAALGADAHGPLLFRVVQGAIVGDWSPLATVVRVPTLSSLTCAADGTCVLSGTGLFLISKIADASDTRAKVDIPDGFTGSEVKVPRPGPVGLTLTLRDAPGLSVVAKDSPDLVRSLP